MSQTYKHFIAYFLLLCMVITLIPIGSFHDHEKESHHCEDDLEFESDLCHISIYHKASLIDHCEHEQHISDAFEECELCKYITSRRFELIFDDGSYAFNTTTLKSIQKVNHSFSLSNFNNYILGRAPPVV